jgi:small subunit ribosomal protein S27Ae
VTRGDSTGRGVCRRPRAGPVRRGGGGSLLAVIFSSGPAREKRPSLSAKGGKWRRCKQVTASQIALLTLGSVCAGVSSEMRLSVSGHQLEDEELLEELPEECTLAMNLELLGGGKKRKKKTYTKPKKIKKKHKKVKLAVLKYYRVDQASGKVTRLRKECPNEACGAGTFMAMHFNRHYCGKCTATYMLENPGKDPNADKNKKKEAAPKEEAAPAKGASLPLTQASTLCAPHTSIHPLHRR